MAWTTAFLALTPTILLFVQGTSCLMRRQQDRSVPILGLLSILLSVLGLLLYLLLVTDSLVLSPEFGLVLVQGPLAWFGLVLLLMGIAVSGGMGLLVCRLRTRPEIDGSWYLALVIAVLLAGLSAVSRLSPLNLDDSKLFRIYAYDVWWPSLLIWLSVCLSESVSTIVRLQHWTARLWLAMAMTTGLALAALARPTVGDPSTHDLWQGFLRVVLPIGASAVAWQLLSPDGRGSARPALRLRHMLILLPAVVGLLNVLLRHGIGSSPATPISWTEVWLWVQGTELRTKTVTWQHVWEWSIAQGLWLMTWWSWLVWLVWPVLAGQRPARGLHHAWRRNMAMNRLLSQLDARRLVLLGTLIGLAWSLSTLLSMLSIGSAVAWVVEGTFVLAVAPTLPFSIDQTCAVVGFLIAWTALAEMIAGGPLRALYGQMTDHGLWAAICMRLAEGSRRLANWLRTLQRRRAVSDEGGQEPGIGWLQSLMRQGFSMIGLALAAFVVLVALTELPDADKTVILPFKVYVFSEHDKVDQSVSARDELGQALSERVVHTYNRLRRVLRQEVVLLLKPDDEETEGKVKFTLIPAADGTNFGGTALGKSAEVEFSGIKVPLGAIASPVRSTLRWLLGGRIINGSVQQDPQGYVLLAHSSAGETWRVEFATNKFSHADAMVPAEAVASMANQLAFNIISTDPALRPLVTKSRGAFEAFRQALRAWKEFEAKQDYAALGSAIEQFRVATLHDAGFAFAHYRLGLALQRDGQPGAAIIAFRTGLEADPGFVPAHIALASLLYDFERHYQSGGAGLPPTPYRSPELRQKNMREAYHLWQRILQFPNRTLSEPNRAAAYYGLCREALQRSRPSARQARFGRARDEIDTDRWYYLAYYHCKQAGGLYARLSARQYASLEIKTGQATVFRNLGVTLTRIRRTEFAGIKPAWNCWLRDPEDGSYTRQSLRYYAKALELLPENHRIRCHVASAAYVLGDVQLMERLDADSGYHVSLANTYRRFAERLRTGRSSANVEQPYAGAIQEYQRALRLNPVNMEALVGYASTYWEWQVNRPATKFFDGPDSTVGYWAHTFADRALHLVTGNLDPATVALTRAVLGKVLLVQARSAEAVEQLETAHAVLRRIAEQAAEQHRPTEGRTAPEIDGGSPKSVASLATTHQLFREIGWALAQAYRCVVVSELRAADDPDHLLASGSRASELMAEVRQLERGREFRPYTELLDRWKPLVCEFGHDSAVDRIGLLDGPKVPVAAPCSLSVAAVPCGDGREAS